MPKKEHSNMNFAQSLDYDQDDDTDQEDNLSEEDLHVEKFATIDQNLPCISQILIVSRLLGKRQFCLSRNGTKKFLNKVRQFQELSQVGKADDLNYGSRMGKAAEILCKLSALSEMLKISIEILQ
ncbi:hypothetical protein NGRA_3095 [Nosema granulosis]|uniref:Uncharacterized protein n=1 Tax=Nosema granulosis TaxID=83296 RepID=A0A9P6GWU9_9MICR|nr:hypothetical protein NGRA_3095 [Nosema granulosis]